LWTSASKLEDEIHNIACKCSLVSREQYYFFDSSNQERLLTDVLPNPVIIFLAKVLMVEKFKTGSTA
jgi:hypothetical protein